MSPAIAKPQLRGLLQKQIGRNLAVTFVLVASVVTTMHFTLVKGRKQKYADYYRDLDCDDMFQKMKDAGVFQSCPK